MTNGKSNRSRPVARAKGIMHKYLPGMISCAQFEEFMIDYSEGTLPAGQRRRFEAHLNFCRECRDYLAAYNQTIALGKAAFAERDAPLPDDVPEDLIAAVLAARGSNG